MNSVFITHKLWKSGSCYDDIFINRLPVCQLLALYTIQSSSCLYSQLPPELWDGEATVEHITYPPLHVYTLEHFKIICCLPS